MEKLNKIYEELLAEGGTDILYHFTYSGRLLNMLDTNTLYLTNSISAKAEATKGKTYFMSFSRTKSTEHGYGAQFRNPGSVRLKFNGQKLGHNYKFMPIDYWQYPRTPEFMNQKSGDEMEDRIISDKDEIPNANKYIISIDVFISKEGIEEELITKAKKLGIKINFFNNYKDFASGDSNRAITPNINTENNPSYNYTPSFDYTLGCLVYKEDELRSKVFNTLKSEFNFSDEQIEFYNKKVEKYHEKLRYYLQDDDYYLTDLTNSLSAELHNNKRSENKISRYIIREFIKDLKKSGASSIKEYLLHKLYKGKKRQKDFNLELNKSVNQAIKKGYSDNFNSYNHYIYDVDGNGVDGYLTYPPVKKYINGKLKELQNITSDYILNNNDMFKYSYEIGTSELRKKLNLNDDEINNVLSNFQKDNIDAEDIKGFLNSIIWDVDEVIFSEINRIGDEVKSQSDR